MYIERDKEFDLIYISFQDKLEAGEVAETREVLPGAYVDLDANGKLLGIEITNSKNVLGISAGDLNLSGELLGVKEAAKLAGKDRANFLRDLATKPDFPKPVACLASGQLWLSKDIERYLRDREAPTAQSRQDVPQPQVNEGVYHDLEDYEDDQHENIEDSDQAFYPNCVEDQIQQDKEGYGTQTA